MHDPHCIGAIFQDYPGQKNHGGNSSENCKQIADEKCKQIANDFVNKPLWTNARFPCVFFFNPIWAKNVPKKCKQTAVNKICKQGILNPKVGG